jgi:hypothetical protein
MKISADVIISVNHHMQCVDNLDLSLMTELWDQGYGPMAQGLDKNRYCITVSLEYPILIQYFAKRQLFKP